MFKTELNRQPYFNDFDVNDGFYHVAFRPGVGVQTRELAQVQSILQNQIQSLGKHIFTEGSMVVPGGVSLKLRSDYVKFDIISNVTVDTLMSRTDLMFKSRDRDVKAKIQHINPGTGTEQHQAFIEYTSAGNDYSNKFNTGVSGIIYYKDGSDEITVANVTITSIGQGTIAQVDEGIFFIRGCFLRNSSETLVISADVPVEEARVGFIVTEEIITPAEDLELLSNAQGEPGEGREGAHRLRVTLKLAQADVNTTVDDFVELSRVEDNQVVDTVKQADYSIIEEALAQRTYEQAGDYNVDPHEISIVENELDPDRMKYILRHGVSYVRGYRVENDGPVHLDVPRARETRIANNAVTAATFGRYIHVTNVQGVPIIDPTSRVLLLDAGSGVLATARLLSVEPTTVAGDTSSLRLYLTSFDASVMPLVTSVRVEYQGSTTLMIGAISVVDGVADTTVYGASRPELLFNVPFSPVRTLSPADTGRDTTYSVMKTYRVTLDENGQATIAAGSNMIFMPYSYDSYYVSLTNASVNKLDPGALVVDTTVGNPAGSQLSITVASRPNTEIAIIAPVIKNASQPRTKTLQSHTMSITFANEHIKSLDHTDIVGIVSITDAAGDDVSDRFKLDNGQRDSVYAIGSVESLIGNVSTTIEVEYQYFAHSVGDYFDVDSYATYDYNKIPSYRSQNGTVYDLRNTIDFRQSVDATGAFVNAGDTVKPTSVIRNDVEYYLPRIDAIYVDSNRKFGVVRGVDGDAVNPPKIPDSAMRLYNVIVPAYTLTPGESTVSTIDNRRYTMRDIGKIDSRLANVEYYTSLNTLEQSLENAQVFDSNGNLRYKNGFAADPFKDWRLIDGNDTTFSASIDPDNGGELRPQMVMQALRATVQPGGNHHYRSGVAGVNTSNLPLEEAGQLALPILGTKVSRNQPYATRTINVNPYAVYTWAGYVSLKPTADTWKDVQYNQPIVINQVDDRRGNAREGTVWGAWRTTTQRSRRWITTTNRRSGTVTTFTEWNTQQEFDESVSEVSIPFMRSIDVNFMATNLRPNARVYVFFDDVDVSLECAQDGKVRGEDMITDSTGTIKGVFTVPNREDLKFATGTSLFRVTDSPTDSRDADEFSTAADTTFTSAGTLETRQETIIRTRHLGFDSRSVSQTTTRRVRRDPLAQTFAVSSSVGEIIHSIDVFFTTKSSDIPVTMEVRTVENGIPTGDVITRKTLMPSEVSTSVHANVPTKFTFDEYLFLEEGREYALVLLADTQDYNVGIAQMGEIELGGTYVVAKQPSIGVFFTSQNASTWTEHQNQDMKFTVHRYEFSLTGSITFDCERTEPMLLGVNPISIEVNNRIATINILSHGLQAGQTFNLTGAVGSAGLTAEDLSGSFTVLSVVDHDHITVELPTAPLASGVTGGGFIEYTGAILANAIHPEIDVFAVDGASIDWEYRVRDVTGVYGAWTAFSPGNTTPIGFDGIVRDSGDLQYRAVMSSTSRTYSPVINIDTHNTVALTPRVDTDAILFRYVTQDVMFEDQADDLRCWVSARLPSLSDMKLYVQYINGEDQERVWIELTPEGGVLSQDATSMIEHEFNSASDVSPFLGVRFKIELKGDRNNFPSLGDFRLMALT